MPPQPTDESYSPLALIATLLLALLLFAVFFVSFLVAPLAILVAFYVIFAASDRSKRAAAPSADEQPLEPAPAPYELHEETEEERAARELELRRISRERADVEAARRTSDG